MDLTDHLVVRRLWPHLYRVWLDEANRVITFPLYNLSGQWVGCQEYRPDSFLKAQDQRAQFDRTKMRYFTDAQRNQTSMWGLESLQWKHRFCFVQEGVFDAAALHRLGLPAVAILGNYNPEALKMLATTGKELLTIADAGNGGKMLYDALGGRGVWLEGGPWRDVGDMPMVALHNLTKQILRGKHVYCD